MFRVNYRIEPSSVLCPVIWYFNTPGLAVKIEICPVLFDRECQNLARRHLETYRQEPTHQRLVVHCFVTVFVFFSAFFPDLSLEFVASSLSKAFPCLLTVQRLQVSARTR